MHPLKNRLDNVHSQPYTYKFLMIRRITWEIFEFRRLISEIAYRTTKRFYTSLFLHFQTFYFLKYMCNICNFFPVFQSRKSLLRILAFTVYSCIIRFERITKDDSHWKEDLILFCSVYFLEVYKKTLSLKKNYQENSNVLKS